MSTSDKASNKAQDAKGRVEEAAGALTGDDDLKAKGKAHQAEAAVKDLGEKVKDAASSVKDAITNS